MKVMVIVKATKDSEAGIMPTQELMRDMGNFNEALVKAGIMLSGDGLYPSAQGVRVRFAGKERSVVNGPFAETKELIAGFWVWQVKSMEEAIEWVKRCPNPMLGESEIEVRRVYAPEDFAALDPTGEIRAQEERLIREMESYRLEGPRFENGKEMIVAGLGQRFTKDSLSQIPDLWMKLAPSLKKGQAAYGVCYGGGKDGSFDYMAAIEVQDTTNLPSGFTHMRLAPQRYAVFTHTKHVSKLSETMNAIYTKWLPNSGLQAVHAPALEKYTEEFCPDKGVGGIEVWIPVKA